RRQRAPLSPQEEERMKKLRLIAGILVLGLSAAACGGAKVEDDSAAAPSASTVKIAINGWVGYEADAAVVSYLLEHELGYKVEKVTLAEEPSWQGMESGDVDVVLENWGHPDLKKKYIEEKNVAVE